MGSSKVKNSLKTVLVIAAVGIGLIAVVFCYLLWIIANGRPGSIVELYQHDCDLYARSVVSQLGNKSIVSKQLAKSPVLIQIEIDPNGNLLKSEIKRSSGNVEFDNTAMTFIQKLVPFDPLPARLGDKFTLVLSCKTVAPTDLIYANVVSYEAGPLFAHTK